MIRLERRDHGAALGLYRAAQPRFPLVGAVLLDAQDGRVFVDDAARPACAYVEHAFGFAQILGRPGRRFESALEHYLLADKSFAAPKVRLYTPWLPGFLDDARGAPYRSLRQRFVLPAERAGTAASLAGAPRAPGQEIVEIEGLDVDAVERAFGVTRRFWRSTPDFARGAHAVVAMHDGQPASICYAAAEVDREAEIDVLTRPEHQRLGLGKFAVAGFVRRCLRLGLAPLWDCFSNNAASVQLCLSTGFVPQSPPYPFFTINR